MFDALDHFDDPNEIVNWLYECGSYIGGTEASCVAACVTRSPHRKSNHRNENVQEGNRRNNSRGQISGSKLSKNSSRLFKPPPSLNSPFPRNLEDSDLYSSG